MMGSRSLAHGGCSSRSAQLFDVLRILLRSTNHETAMLASSSEWEVRGDATADGRLAMFNATAVPSARSIRWPDGSEWTLVGPSAPMRWREASGWGLRPRSNG